jgi:hypothetical protein
MTFVGKCRHRRPPKGIFSHVYRDVFTARNVFFASANRVPNIIIFVLVIVIGPIHLAVAEKNSALNLVNIRGQNYLIYGTSCDCEPRNLTGSVLCAFVLSPSKFEEELRHVLEPLSKRGHTTTPVKKWTDASDFSCLRWSRYRGGVAKEQLRNGQSKSCYVSWENFVVTWIPEVPDWQRGHY